MSCLCLVICNLQFLISRLQQVAISKQFEIGGSNWAHFLRLFKIFPDIKFFNFQQPKVLQSAKIESFIFVVPQPWNPGYTQINPDVSGCRYIRIYPDTSGIYPDMSRIHLDISRYIRDISRYIRDTSGYIRIHPGCIRIHQRYIRIHPGNIYTRIHLDSSGYIRDSKAGNGVFGEFSLLIMESAIVIGAYYLVPSLKSFCVCYSVSYMYDRNFPCQTLKIRKVS
jgi:hypothetical protein